jgi:hypothetical protein
MLHPAHGLHCGHPSSGWLTVYNPQKPPHTLTSLHIFTDSQFGWSLSHPFRRRRITRELNCVCRRGLGEGSAARCDNRQGGTVSGAEAATGASEGHVPAPQQDIHPALHHSAPVWWRHRVLQVRHPHLHFPQGGARGTLLLCELQATVAVCCAY